MAALEVYSTAKPFVEQPSSKKTDCIAIRFELEDSHPLPKCARELSFNADMQSDGIARFCENGL